MKIVHDPVEVFRLFLFVREAGQNHGQRVEGIQRWSGGSPGDSYCCELCTMVLDIAFQGDSPIPRLLACQDVYDLAKKNGWIVTGPQPGDLYLFIDANGHAHHLGMYTGREGPLPVGIAGNTSESGTSSNGNGCFEHALKVPPSTIVYVRYPR